MRMLVVRVSAYGTVVRLAHQARQKSDRDHKNQSKAFHIILDNNKGVGVAVQFLSPKHLEDFLQIHGSDVAVARPPV